MIYYFLPDLIDQLAESLIFQSSNKDTLLTLNKELILIKWAQIPHFPRLPTIHPTR